MKNGLRMLSICCVMWGVLFSWSGSFAQSSQTVSDLQQKLDALQMQIDQLKNENQTTSKNVVTKPSKKPMDRYALSPANFHKQTLRQSQDTMSAVSPDAYQEHLVMVAPYTGKPTYDNGSMLIVAEPKIDTDVKLLYRNFFERQARIAAGAAEPFYPRLVFSGAVVSEASYTKPYLGARQSDFNVSDIALDAFAEMNSFSNALLSIGYNHAASATPRRITNSNIVLDKAMFIVGDLKKTPFYGSVGQMHVPFGRYNSNMISSPLTKLLGRTKARAIVVGYEPIADKTPTARVFFFRGDSYHGGSDFAKQYGLDLAYRILQPTFSVTAGGSYLRNLADAEGLQITGSSSNFRGFDISNLESLDHPVGAIDLYATAAHGPFSALAEYLTALRSFSRNDMTFNTHGAQPKAMNIEGAYRYHIWLFPASFAVGYGHSLEALGFNVPKNRYTTAVTVAFSPNIVAELELHHDRNYSRSDTALANCSRYTAYVLNELGRSNNGATLDLGVYF